MSTGENHTITLSNEGIVYAFGCNEKGQLALNSKSKRVSIPTPVLGLPKIIMVSCGAFSTICIDIEGSIWSFGDNKHGQLGTGNKAPKYRPFKVKNIPPALSVSCGDNHTLIITNDENLWSCGKNVYGQLCLGNKQDQLTFQQTSFSSIIRISAGGFHSLFQNNNEEIFGCGYNDFGQLGLGHVMTQIEPCIISNAPPNIIQFCCGFSHSLFLDIDGNTFSVGYGDFIGLGDDLDRSILTQIPCIPPIQKVSGVGNSSYLLDIEGNVWSFGDNTCGQLGHGDEELRNIPTKILGLKDIKQISYGYTSDHFLAQDYQNTLFAIGNNSFNQLGPGKLVEIILTPRELGPEYSTIWGDSFYQNCKNRAKSARK